GMLLAHIAIVEVYWIQLGPMARAFECREVLGIGEDDDGLPIPAGGAPPETLRGKSLALYDELLARARRNTVVVTQPLTDLDRHFTRRRRDGSEDQFNVRWVYYHVLEHQAGHYGQILLLRHQYRVAKEAAATAG